jgi:hypothetical protein
MSPVRCVRLWLRLLVVIWAIAWVGATPLFHIHIPDTTDRWSSLHSGGAHTVFTQDLPGEYSLCHVGHSIALSPREVNSPEVDFVLYEEDRRSFDVHTCHRYDSAASFVSCTLDAVQEQAIACLFISVSSGRAPPV